MPRQFRFVYATDRYEETVAFWLVDIGLDRVSGWDRAPDDRGAIFALGSGLVEVLTPGSGPSFGGCGGMKLLAEVEDADAWWDELEMRGAPVTSRPKDRPWGHRDFSVTDPNGLTVVFFATTG